MDNKTGMVLCTIFYDVDIRRAKKSCFIIITSQQKFVTLNSDMNSANTRQYTMWKLLMYKFVLMSLVLPRYNDMT